MSFCRRTITLLLFILAAFYFGSFGAQVYAAPPAFLWIEGETPASASFAFDKTGFGANSVLSGGQWLQKSIEGKDKIANSLPPEGAVLTYTLDVPEAGEYTLWARIGFERARAPFRWRIGSGPWQQVLPEARTTNLMRLAVWVEVAWLDLGKKSLPAGKTTLELRLDQPKGDRLLFALDALALVKGTWTPDGLLKPGETYRREQDVNAEAQVYSLPESDPVSGKRSQVVLNGFWQAARFDDLNMDDHPYQPISTLPPETGDRETPSRWLGVRVPSNAFDTPELHFANRLLYRTQVYIPASAKGKSFTLHFSATNWIVSVFVDGKLAATHKGVLVPWEADITREIVPGKKNRIEIAVKSPLYARDTNAMNTTLEGARNLPLEQQFLSFQKWVAPIYPSTKGEGDGLACGLVAPVTLSAVGPVYVENVFIRPSALRKSLSAEVTLFNPSESEAKVSTVQVTAEAVNVKTGVVEKTFAPVSVPLKSQDHRVVSTGGGWANPKFWFPVNNPDRYLLRLTVRDLQGRILDVKEEPFGFCEVTTEGTHLKINGVIRNLWNWVEVSGGFKTPEEFLTKYRAEGNRFYRFSYDSNLRQIFPYREAMLDYFDRAGIVGRLSTCIDGMFITYDLKNPVVWENFQEHLQQVVKAYRNHPSILVYSVENELMYINAQNVYGGEMDAMEAKLYALVENAKRIDPSRPYMADGAGALAQNRMEVDCPHYPEPPTQFYPDTAYTFAQTADHSARWKWDRKRPLIVGESFFYAGKLEDQAWIGGDSVFRGRDEADLGAAAYTRLLVEGYRWNGVAGICPWVALERVRGAEKSFSDLAVFTRKREHRAYAGKSNAIAVKVFNDTLSSSPVTFVWSVSAGGRKIGGGSETLPLEAGTAREKSLLFTAPDVSTHTEAILTLRVSQNGKLGFEDTKPISILPVLPPLPLSHLPLAGAKNRNAVPLLLLDRSGRAAAFLKARGRTFTPLFSLDDLKTKSGLLLIGPDTLTSDEAVSSQLLAFAARGGKVIALEQKNPLSGGALPFPVKPTARTAGYAFPQALGTPLFRNLRSRDFTDWAGDFPTVINAYAKPSGGARSLVECGDGLNDTALMEIPCGRGVLAACQLRVGAKLGLEPAADQLLTNLIAAYETYTPPDGTVAVLAEPDSPTAKAVALTGVRSELLSASALGAALEPTKAGPKYRVVVLPGTPQNLASLERSRASLKSFTEAGGWVMLWGVTPAGIADFKTLTGTDRPLRPFRLERVTKEAQEHPLLAALGSRDLTFYGTQEIAFGDYFLSEHVYTDVIGAPENMAPFTQMPDGPADPLAPYKPTFSDNDPYNYVNGLLNSDSWRYIRQIGVGPQGASVTFRFFKPETIHQVNLWNNINYFKIENLKVIVDDDTAHPVSAVLGPTGAKTEIKFSPPRRVEKSITLQIKSWRGDLPGYSGPRLAGLDNVEFLRVISAEEKSKMLRLDNLGGLVAYPSSSGRGGILLNQIKLMDNDPNPQNPARKLRLISTLLQNLGAGSQASLVLIPGVNVVYTPLDLTRFANRYLKPRDLSDTAKAAVLFSTGQSLAHLKVGQQTLSDIEFLVSDYANAPVPQVLMLGSKDAPEAIRSLPQEIKGIPIQRKAATLYFLHTALVTRPIQLWERGDRNFAAPEIARYRVHYEDGSTVDIPVRLEENLDHWLQKSPKSLTGAALAWHVPFPGLPADAEVPALYAMAWNNPKPKLVLTSLDFVSGTNGERAVPALFALTLGTQRK